VRVVANIGIFSQGLALYASTRQLTSTTDSNHDGINIDAVCIGYA
jgi:hypothetical protein